MNNNNDNNNDDEDGDDDMYYFKISCPNTFYFYIGGSYIIYRGP